MGKVIIPDDEVWAWNGSILKPNPEHFEEGHTTGATGKKPRHDQFNYMEQRRDLNLQYLLRMAGLPYDPLEVYPVNARAFKNGHMYVSLENNNQGNDPISSGKWKHEDDDKFPVGTIIINSSDNRNPAQYKGFGIWEAIENDTSINFVQPDSTNLGQVSGSNEMAVPMLSHTHTMAHTHSKGSMRITGNVGSSSADNYAIGLLRKGQNKTSGAMRLVGSGSGLWDPSYVDDDGGYGQIYFDTNYGGWSGNTSSPSNSKTGSSGVSDPKINVKGKVISAIGWIRTE